MMASESGETTEQLMYNISPYLFIVTVVIIIYFVYDRVGSSETWEKYGVKHSSMIFLDFAKGITKMIEENGDTVGMNRGRMVLVTRDLALLKQVMVKDFNSFTDRASGLVTNSLIKYGLFFQEGQDWRRNRLIMSPSFSTGKLKAISSSIEDTARKLGNVLEECAKKHQLIKIKHLTGQYTSEVIAKTAYGLHTDCMGGEDDEFTYYTKHILKIRQSKIMQKVLQFFIRFDGLRRFLVTKLKISLLESINMSAQEYFMKVLDKTIPSRKELEISGQDKPKDFLQSLVAAKLAGDKSETPLANEINSDKLPKTMTDDEVIGHTLLIILAAFETTSTALQMCLYLLASHPDIQEKVKEEIYRVVVSESPTTEELKQLTYTEQVINETLRLYPPVPFISRKARQERTYGDITIPKDASVVMPIFLICRDPKHYPDPLKFDPERFSEEAKSQRDPLAFIPFGYGPRLCIGMRLAYLELKLALVHVLRKVKVELNETTEPKKGEEVRSSYRGFLMLEKPIELAVTLRND